MTSGPLVLVEGASDRAALLTIAARCGADLRERAQVVVLGGITNIASAVRDRGLAGEGRQLLGLYDAAEERFVRRALGSGELAAAGFFRCEADLEEELLRACGVAVAENVLDEQRDLARFRAFQRQPAQRGRDPLAQLHRWIGAGSGRKERYAAALAGALGPADVPGPLAALLARLPSLSADGR